MFINDEPQKQVLPILAKTAVTPTVEAQQRASSLLQLNPGQQVKAEIIANLPNSLYLARVAGEMYKLEIPLNVQPGETLEMTFLTADPRITFQILKPDAGSSVKLSSMGKFLADVVRNADSPQLVQGPLLDNPAQASGQLAARLKTALTQSGLFYESHLAHWAAGGLALQEILKEPQGKLSKVLRQAEEGSDAGDGANAEIADSRTLPFIREQLLLLNSGVHAWRGEAWPGQGMEITIKQGNDEQWEQGIEATLSLDLPRLGGVEAKLRFGAEGVSVEFVCDRPGSSELLKTESADLRSALLSHGLHLNKMAARDGEITK
ncbi:MAG TPA: flagellar hook-length control protein FliK [Geobacter sp.]|nr:flagellar hook-length control protein FliK [Geobacter sp.]